MELCDNYTKNNARTIKKSIITQIQKILVDKEN